MRTLHVFPNSGHRTVFYPLHCADASVASTLGELPELSENAVAWLREKTAKDDWTSPIGKPWLQGRFAREERGGAEVLGFWCAIELNVGTSNRGYVIKRSAIQAAAKTTLEERLKPAAVNGLAADDDYCKSRSVSGSYLAKTEGDLGDNLTINLSDEFEFADQIGGICLDIVWTQQAGDAIKVDLIVDFGNSRTVVLGLEQFKASQGLASVCRPILFPAAGEDVETLDYDVTNFDDAIPDSWFTLMEPVFPEEPARHVSSGIESKSPQRRRFFGLFGSKKKKMEQISLTPHMFRNISPAVIGPVAKKVLSSLDVEGGGLAFLSSPKRYVWDDEAAGANGKTHWTMSRQEWRSEKNSKSRLRPLRGEILRFMPNADADWSMDSWPFLTEGEHEVRADHSRADALVWVALSILEHANKQIQSEAWRKNNQPFLRRELGDILLTYPAGWTEAEIDVFREKWDKARDIFAMSRMENPKEAYEKGDLPDVALELDEAVAPQLAIVFSEMHHMRDYGENWIELYGRKRGDKETVRVMTIDIGGGTTDTSVVEYSDDLPGVGVDLSANLMFKDSTTIAGDRLVKDIVERVMLPMLGEKFAGDKDQKDLYERFFFTRANRDGERAKWSVISRTVIIPMIHHWLRNFSADDVSAVDWRPLAAGASAEQIEQLNNMARAAGLSEGLLDANESVQPDVSMIRKTIQDWFTHIADAHARYLAIFECDLVILTGKPSELPQIRELLEKRLPIFPDRILSAKGYFAGDWLPLSKDGRIADAKLVTAFGTAVFRGVRSGLISGWRIRSDIDQTCRVQNYWGRIAGNLKPFLKNDILLAPGEKEVTARLLTDSFIGRARFLNHVLPEQVYRLVYKGKQQVLADIRVRRKVTTAEGRHYAMSAEALELVSAKNAQTGANIPLTDIQLQLCTLPRAEEFWQDTGRFEVRWPLTVVEGV